MGAEVIKVERPKTGDDTRLWGPPWMKDDQGKDTLEAAYYQSANRNKLSIAIDIATPEGQKLVRTLAAGSDVLIENYKAGSLKKYGLDYDSLKAINPKLVYCSITGFGQTGPYAHRAGYDFLIQGMGGIMSLTGEPNGEPMKVGVGIADVMTGMYAAVGILAALRHRDQTGVGQQIDISLLDSQVAWLVNGGTNYLMSKKNPRRLGNGHPNIVPYQVFPTADDSLIIAVGNDAQFRRFCDCVGLVGFAEDPRYATNVARVAHREELCAEISVRLKARSRSVWIEQLEALGIPCGPVNSLEQVFNDPHVQARGAVVTMPHSAAASGSVDLLANPLKLSETPVTYRAPPPMLNQHRSEILADWLGDTDS
jgi:crotonobetainyl-CoA:carnitine CoA-transferase CaiB-like acyl-CoA transferase